MSVPTLVSIRFFNAFGALTHADKQQNLKNLREYFLGRPNIQATYPMNEALDPNFEDNFPSAKDSANAQLVRVYLFPEEIYAVQLLDFEVRSTNVLRLDFKG